MSAELEPIQPAATHAGKLEKLPPHFKLKLIRELATGAPNTQVAALFGCSHEAIRSYRLRHVEEIEAVRRELGNEFAGLWIADKSNRIAAYEAEVERLNSSPNANHHEWSKARQQALRSVAEELGQLPPKQQVTVVPVVHVVEGVDLGEAFG